CYNYTQTWISKYTDECDNEAAPVVIRDTWMKDTDAPVIRMSASSDDLGCNPTVVAPEFTGMDNCEGAFTPAVATDGPSNDGCNYTQTWTATYTDECGNEAAPVVITYTWMQDTEDPVISKTASSDEQGCNPTDVATQSAGMDKA